MKPRKVMLPDDPENLIIQDLYHLPNVDCGTMGAKLDNIFIYGGGCKPEVRQKQVEILNRMRLKLAQLFWDEINRINNIYQKQEASK